MDPSDLRPDILKMLPDAIGTEADGLRNDDPGFSAMPAGSHLFIPLAVLTPIGIFQPATSPGVSL
jgi:hypothetical protein